MDWALLSEKSKQEDKGVISLVGAGGKTTLMFSLAKWMAACGLKVLTTTTTRIFMPERTQTSAVILANTTERLLAEAEKLMRRHGHITAGAEYLAGDNKIRGLSRESIAVLRQSGIVDWIIVEADGSARRPVKAPASHEPVIPADTCSLVAVIGLGAIGKPFNDHNVFRVDRFAAITGLLPGEPISASSVASVLVHDDGIMRGAPAEAGKFIFLNKAGREDLQGTGEEIASMLREKSRNKLNGILIGSAADHPAAWDLQKLGPGSHIPQIRHDT